LLDEQIIKQIANQKSDNVWLSFLVTKEFLDLYNIKQQYQQGLKEKSVHLQEFRLSMQRKYQVLIASRKIMSF